MIKKRLRGVEGYQTPPWCSWDTYSRGVHSSVVTWAETTCYSISYGIMSIISSIEATFRETGTQNLHLDLGHVLFNSKSSLYVTGY